MKMPLLPVLFAAIIALSSCGKDSYTDRGNSAPAQNYKVPDSTKNKVKNYTKTAYPRAYGYTFLQGGDVMENSTGFNAQFYLYSTNPMPVDWMGKWNADADAKKIKEGILRELFNNEPYLWHCNGIMLSVKYQTISGYATYYY